MKALVVYESMFGKTDSPRPVSPRERASVSGSRSRRVWWRTTSLTWS